LLKHEAGECVKVRVDGQIEEIEILEIKYVID